MKLNSRRIQKLVLSSGSRLRSRSREMVCDEKIYPFAIARNPSDPVRVTDNGRTKRWTYEQDY